MSDAVQDWIAEAKAIDVLAAAEMCGAKLRRSGAERIGPCPACGGDDRFSVNPQQKVWNCRGSVGGRDSVGLVMHCRGLDFIGAVEFMTGKPRPEGAPRHVPSHWVPEPDAPLVAPERSEHEEQSRATDEINALRRIMVPLTGTHAEAYLNARGIIPPSRSLGDLRFVPSLEYWGHVDDGDRLRCLAELPAMLGVIRNASGKVIGLHRTYLDPKEPKKWSPPNPENGRKRNAAKKVLGEVSGGLIRLGPVGEALVLGEGIETTLAYAQLVDEPGLTFAAAVSLGNMAGGSTGTLDHPARLGRNGKPIPVPNGEPDLARSGAELPSGVARVRLLGDGDSDPDMTRQSLLTGARRYRKQGAAVDVHFAPNGVDWNDVLTANKHDFAAPVGFDEFAAERAARMFRSRFGAMFLDQLDAPGPEHEWLIDGLLSVGDKSVTGGPSQSGKSFLAIHAGMCVATGRDFFERTVKPGLVIYQAGEGARGVKKRLRAWRQHFGVAFDRKTPFVLLQNAIDLYTPDGDTNKLLDEVKGICAMYDAPLKLFVIDTLATAAIGAEENSARDIGMVMANIARINAETGAHVMLVHHMNAGGDKLRGSTAIYANIDQTLFVTRDEKTKVRTARLGKQRDDDNDASFQFELLSVLLGEAKDGSRITSCVCLPVGEKEAVRREEEMKGFSLTSDEAIFMKALFTADKTHGRPVPPDWSLGKDVRSIIDYTEVKRAYESISPNDEIADPSEDADLVKQRHRERLKKALQRVRARLTQFNIIGARDGAIFWTGKPIRGFPHTQPKQEEGPIPDDLPDIPF